MGIGFVNATTIFNPRLLFDSTNSVDEFLNHYIYDVYETSNNSELSAISKIYVR